MDPISQGALGATWSLLGARGRDLTRATWIGVFGGILPDADILIRSPSDSLLALDFHRHFTHSLFFIPFGGLIAALLVMAATRGRIPWREALLPATLGYASHGLLDGCTSYGTHLLWPLSDIRVSWSVVSIVDPVYTGILLAGVILAYRRLRIRPALIAAIASMLYLGLGVVQAHRAHAELERLAASRGHTMERSDVRPSIGNNILYRAYYEHAGTYHVDAIRVGWFSDPRVYPGGSIPKLDREAFEAKHALSERKRRDIDRFAHFSNHYLVVHPRHPSVIGDFRYAAVPYAIDPMWGIDMTATPPDAHALFEHLDRTGTPRGRSGFWRMLRGQDVPTPQETR